MVVDAMREVFPDAQLLALWNDAPEKYPQVAESWLAHTPLRHHKAVATPLLPSTWRHILPKTNDLDWLLVSSHLFAQQIKGANCSGQPIPKFVYAHTPARYIWQPELDRRGQSPLVKAAAAALKPLDRYRAREATSIAANSCFVRERVRRSWNRDATVIYPPVDVDLILSVPQWREKLSGDELRTFESLPQDYLLGASRFVPYKRLDWVIKVGELTGSPVVIAGSGPEEAHLKRLAKESSVPIQILTKPSTALLYALYQSARAYIFPPVEDFGIMPVEAMAAGCRVLVGTRGGAAESVGAAYPEGIVPESGPHAISEKLLSISDGRPDKNMLKQFSRVEFQRRIRAWVEG